jgi:hypothetical protein
MDLKIERLQNGYLDFIYPMIDIGYGRTCQPATFQISEREARTCAIQKKILDYLLYNDESKEKDFFTYWTKIIVDWLPDYSNTEYVRDKMETYYNSLNIDDILFHWNLTKLKLNEFKIVRRL